MPPLTRFMAENWIEIAWVDYAFKLLVSLIFFIPGLWCNHQTLGQSPCAECIKSNPFGIKLEK